MDPEAAGPRLGELEFHAWLRWAQVTDDAQAVVQPLTARFGASTDEVLASPIVLVGSVPEIVDRLHARRERWGYSYVTVQQPAAREFAPVLAALAA